MTTTSAAADRPVPVWLIVSAVSVGALLALPMATEQHAIEGSLVLSGAIPLPRAAIMGRVFFGYWTLLHQIGALAFAAGLSQETVNYFFCMLSPAAVVGAEAMLIYGFCGRPVFSLVAAIVCFLSGVATAHFASPDYPLYGAAWSAPMSAHTYGIFANALAAWTIGALVGGRPTLAGVSAAVLVAAHAVLGVYIIGMLLVVLAARHAGFSDLRTDGLAKGLLCGGVVTVVSFAGYFLTQRTPSTPVDPTAFAAYMKYWDYHRNLPMTVYEAWRVGSSVLALAGVLVAFLALSRTRPMPHAGAMLLLATVVASAVLYFVFHLAPRIMPSAVFNAIPGRLLNIHAELAGAIIVGFLAWRSRELMDRTVTFVILAIVLIGTVSLPAESVMVASRIFAGKVRGRAQPDPSAAFWSTVRQSGVSGLVLTSTTASFPAMHYGHLPILLDGGSMDFVPYLPGTARGLSDIVEAGYGVPFADPPPALRFHGTLLEETGRAYWASLTPDDWAGLGRRLGIAGVVAPSDWQVGLPVVASGPAFTFYRVARP